MVHSKPLTAVVVGAGWAGEMHTQALQHAGVEVVAICARDAAVVQSVAARLGVARASTDWRASLRDLRPDIVTLATPADLRSAVVEQAALLGCHVICEKPLAATAEEAQHMLAVVEHAGVRHAYAATQSYDPGISWAAELIAQGRIGTLRAIEIVFCGPFSNAMEPWGWGDMVAQGGGMMSLVLTHVLAMIERAAGGSVRAVAGQAQVFRHTAPVLPDAIHDSRIYGQIQVTAEQAAALEWRPRDGEEAFCALFQLVPESSPHSEPISVLFNCDICASAAAPNNGWRFRGSESDLTSDDLFALTLTRRRGEEQEALQTPQQVLDTLPTIGDDAANKWAALARDVAADIRGEPHHPYLTFRDGWRYQTIIDTIRHRRGWYQIDV